MFGRQDLRRGRDIEVEDSRPCCGPATATAYGESGTERRRKVLWRDGDVDFEDTPRPKIGGSPSRRPRVTVEVRGLELYFSVGGASWAGLAWRK